MQAFHFEFLKVANRS